MDPLTIAAIAGTALNTGMGIYNAVTGAQNSGGGTIGGGGRSNISRQAASEIAAKIQSAADAAKKASSASASPSIFRNFGMSEIGRRYA